MLLNILQERCKNGNLNISIGIDLLFFAIQQEIQEFKITNSEGCSKDIVAELMHEQEDGTTLIHRMIDKAANFAIENGSNNCEEIKEN